MHIEDRTELDRWFAGFFDAEGYITMGICSRESRSTGFEITPMAALNHKQLAGIIDGDGHVGVQIRANDANRLDYQMHPNVGVSQTRDDRLVNALSAYGDRCGVAYSVTERTRDEPYGDQFNWSVTGTENTKRLLEPIQSDLLVKREQATLLLEEIIPRMESGLHLDRRGFVELMGFVDRLRSFNSGGGSKYTQEYFQNLWFSGNPESDLD